METTSTSGGGCQLSRTTDVSKTESRLLSHTSKWFARVLRGVEESVYDFAVSHECFLCRRTVNGHVSESGLSGLCEACRTTWPEPIRHACAFCGARIAAYADPRIRCGHCSKDRFAFSSVIALGEYQGSLIDYCRIAKDFPSPRIHGWIVKAMLEINQERVDTWRPRVVVPTPQHWWNRWRSPNLSAEVLASEFARQLKLPLDRHLLRKRRWTAKQAGQAPGVRRSRLKNAFTVQGNPKLDGVSVLLIDDILTTGATAHELSRVLKGCGAAEVNVAVMARGTGAR